MVIWYNLGYFLSADIFADPGAAPGKQSLYTNYFQMAKGILAPDCCIIVPIVAAMFAILFCFVHQSSACKGNFYSKGQDVALDQMQIFSCFMVLRILRKNLQALILKDNDVACIS